MQAGELWVRLGVRGADEAVKAIQGVTTKMTGLGESALLTKAAIAGVMFGAQQLASTTNNLGASLQLFTDRTGMSTKFLQAWFDLMRQGNVTEEETTKSIDNIHKAFSAFNRGEFPRGFSQISKTLGLNIDWAAAQTDHEHGLNKLREFAHKFKGTTNQQVLGQLEDILGTFGGLPNFNKELRMSEYDLSKAPSSRVLKDNEISQLAAMKVGWANIGKELEVATARLNIMFGPTILQGVRALTASVLSLGQAFRDMIPGGNIGQTILNIFDKIHDYTKGGFLNTLGTSTSDLLDAIKNFKLPSPTVNKELNTYFRDRAIRQRAEENPGWFAPMAVPTLSAPTSSTFNINTEVNLDGSSNNPSEIAQAISSHVKVVINDAFRQFQTGQVA